MEIHIPKKIDNGWTTVIVDMVEFQQLLHEKIEEIEDEGFHANYLILNGALGGYILTSIREGSGSQHINFLKDIGFYLKDEKIFFYTAEVLLSYYVPIKKFIMC